MIWGRIAKTGSVKVDQMFEIEQYPTLFQMTSTVRCRTKARAGGDFQRALPAGINNRRPENQYNADNF